MSGIAGLVRVIARAPRARARAALAILGGALLVGGLIGGMAGGGRLAGGTGTRKGSIGWRARAATPTPGGFAEL